MGKLTDNELTKVVKYRIKEHIQDIINEEIKEAQERVSERIHDLIPDITSQMVERIGFAISEKQIIFTIKPKE